MLQQSEPDDYVIDTGETHSVRDFLDEAFGQVGQAWHDYVRVDPRYLRPTEVDVLQGDSTKARERLGWRPLVGFLQLVKMMVDADMAAVRQEIEGTCR